MMSEQLIMTTDLSAYKNERRPRSSHGRLNKSLRFEPPGLRVYDDLLDLWRDASSVIVTLTAYGVIQTKPIQ